MDSSALVEADSLAGSSLCDSDVDSLSLVEVDVESLILFDSTLWLSEPLALADSLVLVELDSLTLVDAL